MHSALFLKSICFMPYHTYISQWLQFSVLHPFKQFEIRFKSIVDIYQLIRFPVCRLNQQKPPKLKTKTENVDMKTSQRTKMNKSHSTHLWVERIIIPKDWTKAHLFLRYMRSWIKPHFEFYGIWTEKSICSVLNETDFCQTVGHLKTNSYASNKIFRSKLFIFSRCEVKLDETCLLNLLSRIEHRILNDATPIVSRFLILFSVRFVMSFRRSNLWTEIVYFQWIRN